MGRESGTVLTAWGLTVEESKDLAFMELTLWLVEIESKQKNSLACLVVLSAKYSKDK
jgi:hypothetical protein